MMAGNPNWWSMNGMHPHDEAQHHHLSYSSSSSSSSHFALYADSSSLSSQPGAVHSHDHQDFPVRSWSQLLMGELSGDREDQEGFCGGIFHHQKKLDNWEDQVLNLSPSFTRFAFNDVKQEVARSTATSHQQIYQGDEFPVNSWLHPSNSFSNFSGGKPAVVDGGVRNHQPPRNRDHSSEVECTGTSKSPAVVVSKKARVQHSSTQPALKVRKEKLGDRITALHQIVSPFGKTDTASVLSEAIGYIRFLQAQIEALSSPYMRNQHSAVRERNCSFTEAKPEESGQIQFLNDNMDTKGKGASKASESIPVEDLRSRGLCLVPISCIQNVGNDTSADYWTPSAFGGGF